MAKAKPKSRAKPFSLRMPGTTLERLRARSAQRGESRSRLVQRYTEEGLRMEEHPGVVFRDGPAGRRAGLATGPDVWEVMSVIRDLGVRGDRAVSETAAHLSLDPTQVRVAIRYYAAYPDEIDDRIRRNEEGAERARQSWLREQAAIA